MIRTAGSAMVVEIMRQGASPLEACKEVVIEYQKFIKQPEWEYLQLVLL